MTIWPKDVFRPPSFRDYGFTSNSAHLADYLKSKRLSVRYPSLKMSKHQPDQKLPLSNDFSMY